MTRHVRSQPSHGRRQRGRIRRATLAALVAVSLVGVASATPTGEASTQVVHYAVTDLGTLGGSVCAGFSGQTSIGAALSDSGYVAGSSCKFTVPFNRLFGAFRWSGGAITDLGVTGSALGINNAGQVVGSTGQPGFEFSGSAFIWDNGVVTGLGPVLGGFSAALDINNQGQIVGIRGSPPNTASWRAFLYDTPTGAVTDLGSLGGTFRSTATSINDAGHVAGWASLPDQNTFHAFLWRNGVMTDLGALSTGHSFARAINATDLVVGDSSVPAGAHAFAWQNGTMSDLGTLGGPFSAAYGVNDRAQIVGYALTETFAQRAFVWRAGVMRDLNDLIPASSGWILREARAINNGGQIVGTGRVGNEDRAFLLTPIGDATPPTLVVPEEVTANASGPAGAVVSYTASAEDDVDGPVPVDCSPASASIFPIGTTRVTCTASDTAGNEASASFDVHVKGANEQLDELIASVTGLGPGLSLADKLIAASAALDGGDVNDACEKLRAFANQANAQSGKSLTPVLATELVAAANRIRAVLDC